ncbi:hypothetical protein Cenrod_2415 [Candidatus Symbiobacter mobilis CR]|uniref:Uncharacterized protein n=1 Tax=Candidatus Symbiobacter mobilis CR TaxID=946483 RepID=U5NE27_9BURK|nr:hypothetical protein Cenrod_2415 [Candidatus Symbiobacter mobilis CR]
MGLLCEVTSISSPLCASDKNRESPDLSSRTATCMVNPLSSIEASLYEFSQFNVVSLHPAQPRLVA